MPEINRRSLLSLFGCAPIALTAVDMRSLESRHFPADEIRWMTRDEVRALENLPPVERDPPDEPLLVESPQ